KDVVPFSQVMPEFIEIVESHSFVDIFLTGFITTDEQALDIPKVAREFGVTSFKYYLHMMQGPRTQAQWAGRERGGWLGFDDGTIYLGMEKAAEIGPPGISASTRRTMRSPAYSRIGSSALDERTWPLGT